MEKDLGVTRGRVEVGFPLVGTRERERETSSSRRVQVGQIRLSVFDAN